LVNSDWIITIWKEKNVKQSKVNEIGTCLLLLLDGVDYITYPVCLTEMVGAAVPEVVLKRCLRAKEYILEDLRRLNPR